MSTTEQVFMAYSRATQDARESERRLAEMTNILLLGNSFLVAAFAVILGQPIAKVVHYVLASVGILLCLLLLLGINSAWRLYRARIREVRHWSLALEQVWEPTSRPVVVYHAEMPWLAIWGFSRFFAPGTIYRLWLPCLFLFMWVMLLIFAID